MSISTASLIWMETKLTYVAVVARGVPIVKVLAFKHNENKFYHFYNINVCPSLPNPETLDSNPEQSYLDLPSEVKISTDAAFVMITSFNGEVKLIRLPPIVNPLRDSDEAVNANPVPA
jgi:hypothetical protein